MPTADMSQLTEKRQRIWMKINSLFTGENISDMYSRCII